MKNRRSLDPSDDAPKGRRLAAALTSAPALWTLSLAGLYTVGLFRQIGELRAAHLPVDVALEAVPLQEHLIAGIAVIVNPQTLVLVVGACLAYFSELDLNRSSQPVSAVAAGARTSKGWRTLLMSTSLPIGVAAAVLLFISWDLALILVVMLGVIFGGLLLAKQIRVGHGLTLTLLVSLLGALAATAYFTGRLPYQARVELQSGHTIKGSYLALNGGDLYLGQNGAIMVIPEHEIRSIVTEARPVHAAPRSVGEMIVGVKIGPRKLR